jgi:23S rRNA (adenine2503-C2)-methyltransferase
MECVERRPDITWTDRLNIHYARMGEPTWNENILSATIELKATIGKTHKIHPVVSTMMPKRNKRLQPFLEDWLDIKDQLNGEAGLQISINTTDESVRSVIMPEAMPISEVSDMFYELLAHREVPLGRKITLNFAITDAKIDAKIIRDMFSPRYFICKITPMHVTKAAASNGLVTNDGYEKFYPYQAVEEELKKEGFDVLVFIPSKEEDESRITCGNAVLSDK